MQKKYVKRWKSKRQLTLKICKKKRILSCNCSKSTHFIQKSYLKKLSSKTFSKQRDLMKSLTIIKIPWVLWMKTFASSFFFDSNTILEMILIATFCWKKSPSISLNGNQFEKDNKCNALGYIVIALVYIAIWTKHE